MFTIRHHFIGCGVEWIASIQRPKQLGACIFQCEVRYTRIHVIHKASGEGRILDLQILLPMDMTSSSAALCSGFSYYGPDDRTP